MEMKTFRTIKLLIGLTDGKSSLPNGRLLRLSTRGTDLVRCLLSSWTCISVLLKSFNSFLMAAYKETHTTDDVTYIMQQTYTQFTMLNHIDHIYVKVLKNKQHQFDFRANKPHRVTLSLGVSLVQGLSAFLS